MSINAITDRFGEKLKLHTKTVNAETLTTDYLSSQTVNTYDLAVTNVAAISNLRVFEEIYELNDIIEIDGTTLTLNGSSPANFVNLGVILNTRLNLHYSQCNVDPFEKGKLEIKGSFDFQCGINPLIQNATIGIKLINIPTEFHNSNKISAECQVYNTFTYGNKFALSVVDTSTLGEINLSLFGQHDSFPLNQASFADFSLTLVES